MFSNTKTETELNTPSNAINLIEQVAGATAEAAQDGRYRARYWMSGRQNIGTFCLTHDLTENQLEQLTEAGFEPTDKNPDIMVWWFDAVEHHRENQ